MWMPRVASFTSSSPTCRRSPSSASTTSPPCGTATSLTSSSSTPTPSTPALSSASSSTAAAAATHPARARPLHIPHLTTPTMPFLTLPSPSSPSLSPSPPPPEALLPQPHLRWVLCHNPTTTARVSLPPRTNDHGATPTVSLVFDELGVYNFHANYRMVYAYPITNGNYDDIYGFKTFSSAA